MLLGLLGMAIGFPATLALFEVAGFEPGPAFWVAMAVGVPLTVVYLWTHRAPDNSRFDPE